MARHGKGAIGATIVVALVVTATFAPIIAPFNPTDAILRSRLKPPVWYPNNAPGRILGTDQLGRDLLSRIIYGARISLVVAATTVVVSGITGVFLGLMAGYHGGMIDHVIMRIVDIQLAFPFILLAILVLAVLRPSAVNVVVVLVLSNWVIYCRLIRAQMLSLREREFVVAAHAVGCGDARILFRHILPNLVAPMTVVAAFQVAQVIVTESVLSFLGLGIQPPTPSWGLIIGEGREYLDVAWWISTFPGLILMMTVIAVGFLGDWLRDVLDPTLRIG